jgi:hypothetical protein
MTANRSADIQSDSEKSGVELRRRGLFAVGAAVVGAVVAKIGSPGQAEAAPGGNFILGADNDAGTLRTQITANVANENTMSVIQSNDTGNAMVGVHNGQGGGLVGSVRGTGTALAGISDNGIGLSGTSFATVAARSGVGGFSTAGYGVRGGTGAAANQEGSGVFGEGTGQIGVKGTSVSGAGVFGSSIGGNAGEFVGPVLVTGNLNVNGAFTATGIKSAAVRSASGSLVRVYCMESPESYFEDFGEAALQGGGVVVALRSDFAEIVDTNGYQIFLTEYGDFGGLYVSSRGPSSFTVVSRAGAASGSFGYRIVARRKDVKAPRLDPVTIPQGMQGVPPPREVKTPDRLPGNVQR